MGASSNLLCEDGLDMACPGTVPPKHVSGQDRDTRGTSSAAVLGDGTQLSPTRPPPALSPVILAPHTVVYPLAMMAKARHAFVARMTMFCFHTPGKKYWGNPVSNLCRRGVGSEPPSACKGTTGRQQTKSGSERTCPSGGVPSLGHACHLEPGSEGGLKAGLGSHHDHRASVPGRSLRSPRC